MKLFVYLLVSVVFYSCSSGIEINIKNNTDYDFEKIIVSNGFDSIQKPLLKGETFSEKLVFSEDIKHDGSYSLTLIKSNTSKKYSFGYFSNGIPESQPVFISITNDTIDFSKPF